MSYTRDELDELGKGDELTQEAIEMLLADESFFYEVFEHGVCPLMREPMRAWMNHDFFKGRPVSEPGQGQLVTKGRRCGTTVKTFELATGTSFDGVLYGLEDASDPEPKEGQKDEL